MSDITVSKGGKATFSCELPDESYIGSWNHEGKKLAHDGSRVLITQNKAKHSLVITKTNTTDAGEITFETTKGGVKVPFKLIVTEPPSIDPVEFEKCAKALEGLQSGGKLVLKVPFSGASPITASWKFNEKIIKTSSRCTITTTSDSSTLTLTEFNADDCGTYEVTLKNVHGEIKVPVEVTLSDVSEIKFETVQQPGSTTTKSQTITIEQEQTEVMEAPSKPGGSIKFDNMSANRFTIGLTVGAGANVTNYIVEKCESGKSDWQEAGTFPATEKSFVITDLPVGKRYMFRVRATNKLGVSEPLESRAVNVQPPSNPPDMDAAVLEKLKSEQLPKAGKDFKLKIPYVGHPLPIAVWSKDGKKLNTKGRISAETTDNATTFTITGVGAEDSGEYNLLLKNKAGSNTVGFKMTVIDAPSQPIGPIDFDLVTGTDASFSWNPPKSDGGRPITGYEIEKKDTKSPNWSPATKVGPDETTCTVEGLTTGVKYTFRVKAMNQEGESKPLISQPVLASGPPGSPGAPSPGKVTSSSISLTWDQPKSDGGSPVTSYVMEMKEDNGDWEKVPHKSVENLCASIKNLKEDSSYKFRVAAVNSSGQGRFIETDKPIVAMDAPEPPVIEEALKATLAEPHNSKAGEDVVLKVPFTGRPKPVATWQKDGVDLEFPEGDTTKESVVEKGSVTLTLRGVKRSETGAYNVKLTNTEGETEAKLNLVVKSAPGNPTDMKVLKASSKAITVGWKAPEDDGGTKITQYVMEKKDDGKEVEWTRAGKILPGEKLQFVADHVEKGTSYAFRVSAFNQLGNSGYLESEFILADDKYKPPGQPGVPQITDIKNNSCVLSWTEPTDDGGSLINGYLIELRKQNRRNWVSVNEFDLTLKNSGYTVNKLQEGSEYSFRVTAHNEGGNGTPGLPSQKIVARDPVPPPPPVTGVKVTDMTDNSVSLEWDTPEDLTKYAFNGYVVEKCKEGTTNWMACNDYPIRTNKYMITRMFPGDRYSFRVRGINDGGYGDAHALEFMEVRQLQEKPSIKVDKSLQETGIDLHANNTVRIVASVSGKPTPLIRWIKDDTDLDRRCAITTQDGVSQMIMRNVTKADSGVYKITATNSSGTIEIPIKISVRDTPDPPSHITIGDLTEDGQLEIKWKPPANDGGHPIKHYCLQMRDAYSRSFQTVQDKIKGTSYVMKHLKPGFTYYFRVIAENELGRGDGDQSNLVTVVQRRGPLKIEKTDYRSVKLQKPAQFHLSLKPISVSEHSTARFTCAVGGLPEPEVTWYKEDYRIKPNNKYSIKNSYGVCTLTVHDCRPRDAGMYRCVAQNPSGKASAEANLNIKHDLKY
uniref:twitchin-like n=1 Tax=Styela clava TaxID=7725 RepID=UPI0019399B1D|nr:twitchin-like [Styela clava]